MKSSSLSTALKSPYEWKASVLVLIGTVLLPMLVHLIPYQGQGPLGARLLPIFLFPMVGVIWFRWQVGLLGALAPLISYLITGQPQGGMLLGLTIQLVVFIGVIELLHRQKFLRWIVGPLGYVLSLVASRSLLQLLLPQWSMPMDVQTSLLFAWPGILILLVVSVIAAVGQRTSPTK